MSNTIAEDYRKFKETSGYCTPPGKAACALRSARVLADWRKAEKAGLVRLLAEEEQENYFDTYGTPDDPKEVKAIADTIDRLGCYRIYTETWVNGRWLFADSIGMCVYRNPLDPFENCYVIDLMQEALDLIPQEGEH
jgi:hypothetical protein